MATSAAKRGSEPRLDDALSETRTRFTGELGDVSVPDLFQTLEMSQKPGLIEFRTDVGDGTVYFANGRIIDAEIGPAQGEAALHRLLLCDSGLFELKFKKVEREPRCELSSQAVLLEGLRLKDEWAQKGPGLPSPGSESRRKPASLSPGVTKLRKCSSAPPAG